MDETAAGVVAASASGQAAREQANSGASNARDFGAGDDSSLDYLIRPLEERRRDRQAEGLGGLEVEAPHGQQHALVVQEILDQFRLT